MFNFCDNVDREPATVDFRQKKVTNLKVKFVANLSTLSPVCTGSKEADSCLAKCPLHFLRNSIKDDQFSCNNVQMLGLYTSRCRICILATCIILARVQFTYIFASEQVTWEDRVQMAYDVLRETSDLTISYRTTGIAPCLRWKL